MSTLSSAPTRVWSNWGRNQHATPATFAAPSSIEEVQQIVADATYRANRVKAVGAGHSFSAIAVPTDLQLSLENLRGLVSIDPQAQLATFAAGTCLHEIPELLAPYDFAMENLGDIDRQSLAGAISTGTHGSGARFGGLGTQVAGLAIVTADGELLRISEHENADLLDAAAISLGALGIIVEVTLRCVQAFPLLADERSEPIDDLIDSLPGRAYGTDHLDIYWFPHTNRALVKSNTRLSPGSPVEPPHRFRRWFDDEFLSNRVFSAMTRLGSAAPQLVPTINRVANAGSAQRSYSDHSHRVFIANRSVRFVEQEYALPAENVPEALLHIRALIERRGWRISFPIEVRFSASDELWMSTAFGRPSGYIAVHRYFRDSHEEYFRAVEEICVALGGRPHWGKVHTQTAESLRLSYPRFDDFVALRDRLDPRRTFTNPYLDGVLGA